MKKLIRLLALLMALLLVVSMTASVFAEEEEDTSAYIFDYNVADNGYTGPRYQYFSPYVVDFVFDDTPSYIQTYVFTLYNTLTGQVIPAYCTDITVGAYSDRHYRQQNLEDSTYAASSAELLRAIILNGFYLEPIEGETNEAHAARVAAKLQALSAVTGVEDLTIGEAITGTQTAIWQAAHGTRLSFPDYVRTIYTNKLPNTTKYYDLCNEERENGHINYTVSTYGSVTLDTENDAWLNERIGAVHDYLLSLDPVPPTMTMVSNASFLYTSAGTRADNGDGTYDITVRTTLDLDMGAEDSLTLTASIADTYTSAKALTDGQQVVELTIENVPEESASGEIALVIEGEQTASEVFLYDAIGDRDAAQSMIGMHSDRALVRASARTGIDTSGEVEGDGSEGEDPSTGEGGEIEGGGSEGEDPGTGDGGGSNLPEIGGGDDGSDTGIDRIVNFHKVARDGHLPLEGIIFDIYPVATMQEYISGAVDLPEPEDYLALNPDIVVADYTVITDVNGEASLNLSQHGLPDGVYLIVEREHPAIASPWPAHYIRVPWPELDESGQGGYVVNLYPKNDVKGDVKIEKDVEEIGNNEASVGAYENHTWIIGASVPEDIADGKSYVITDELDNRLDYVGNMKVRVETVDGEQILLELTADTDYTLTVHDYDSLSEGKPHDSFELSLTKDGMIKIGAAIADKNADEYMVRVYFDAQVNANAEMGEDIPNDAILRYTNSVNFKFEAESDKPFVNVGGVQLLKVDSKNNAETLAGAEFQLLRRASEAEVAAGEGIIRIDGIVEPLVQETFFVNPDFTGQKVTHVVTDENGEAGFYGLAYGDYYILETKAPSGYNLPGAPIKIAINATTHLEENTIVIENVSGTILPETGGIGTTVFTVFGVALMGASFLLLIGKKKRNDCE